MKRENKEPESEETAGQKHQPPHISAMQPLTKEAYGGGMYGTDDGEPKQPEKKPPASATQSADGPAEATVEPKHKPPPSTGDRDLDITGQSYIQ
ncbi:transcription activator-related [Striga hermonthica]|uniref:Transcription activator-related n=1 Tax=Striga hermonthica TaxID=68872 RepID=A0A9N7NC21_STRHE|nr:transcription activator-related [Striga hermonthica]